MKKQYRKACLLKLGTLEEFIRGTSSGVNYVDLYNLTSCSDAADAQVCGGQASVCSQQDLNNGINDAYVIQSQYFAPGCN